MSAWRKRDPFTTDKMKARRLKDRALAREAREAERFFREGERRRKQWERERKKAEREAKRSERKKRTASPIAGNAGGWGKQDSTRVCAPAPNASEAEWCAYVAHKLRGLLAIEERLQDGTRCDILTTTHAWEVDFARKVYEGVSQAFHYGKVSGRHGGLILLVNPARDQTHVRKAEKVLNSYPPEMRPVLLLCNLFDGRLTSATSLNEELELILPEASPSLSRSANRRHGCAFYAILILLGSFCLSVILSRATDPPEWRADDISSGSPTPTQDEKNQVPLARAPEAQIHADSDPLDEVEFTLPDAESQFLPTTQRPSSSMDQVSKFRTWNDSTGRYSVEARFVKFNHGFVWLQKGDEKLISISPTKLSERDRRYLQELTGGKLTVPVSGHVTAVTESHPGICEVRFVVALRARKGDTVELLRDGVSLGMLRIVAVQERDVVLESATVRPRLGDTAIFLETLRENRSPQ